jgi:GNAT superfamily N-acetyltransferase
MATEDYQIRYLEKPDDPVWEVVGGGINQYNQKHGGEENYQRLCFAIYAPDGTVAGGLIGSTYWNWFYIDLLFVKDELRGQGYGHRLLTLAEDEARKRGAKQVYFDTFSFQAPEFYQQHGYRVFGTLENFPAGHQRYFMTKEL